MNKKEFINELRKNLKSIKKEDREEIVQDYEEHFAIGKKQHRREEEIAKSLGNPKEIAKEAKEELKGSLSLSGMANDTFLKIWKNIKEHTENTFRQIKEFSSKKEIPKEREKKRFIPRLLLTLFNLFIGIWLIFAFYLAVGTLLISSWVITIAGIAMIIVSVFGFFVALPYVSPEFLPLGIFAGISIASLGTILSIFSWQLGKVLSRFISKYIKFNKKIGKKNE